MSGFILAVDDKKRLKLALEESLLGYQLKVVEVTDIVGAKRTLIQAIPNLIICFASLAGDKKAGMKLVYELKAHAELSKVPLILVTEELNEELMQASAESGAAGLITWPLSAEMLERRLSSLLPKDLKLPTEKRRTEAEAAPIKLSTTPIAPKTQNTATNQDSKSPSSTEASEEEKQKLALAQQLLAKVLHGLKTSDLLSVADIEDVPRIVHELCRSVCGIATESSTKPQESKDKELGTTIDLDSVFGLNKNK